MIRPLIVEWMMVPNTFIYHMILPIIIGWMMVPNTFVHADGFYVEDEYT